MDPRPRLATKPSAPSADPVAAVIVPSLKAGAACGGLGFLFGGTAGILKNTTPFLFASASGLQTFALGSSFWAVRSGILQAWSPVPMQHPPSTLVKASALSGGLTGAFVAFVTRGRRNVLPGALMCSLFGFLGQSGVNAVYASPATERDPEDNIFKRMARTRWSPFKALSNEEYVTILQERMLKVDVEIALIDDRISALQRQQELDARNQTSSRES